MNEDEVGENEYENAFDDDVFDDEESAPVAAWARPVASAAVSMRCPNMIPGKSGSGFISWAPKSTSTGAGEIEGELKEHLS